MNHDWRFEVVSLAEVAAKCAIFDNEAERPVILIVDDEHVIADTLTLILAKHGYATLTAYNAESALELAALIPPNLLLSDVVMPGMTGIELATAIEKTVPDCKILLFSGQAATLDLVSHAVYAGTGFTTLSKPIHPAELLSHIADSLRVPAQALPEPAINIKWTKTGSRTISTDIGAAEFA